MRGFVRLRPSDPTSKWSQIQYLWKQRAVGHFLDRHQKALVKKQIAQELEVKEHYVRQAVWRMPKEERMDPLERRFLTIEAGLTKVGTVMNQLYDIAMMILETPDDQVAAKVKVIRENANRKIWTDMFSEAAEAYELIRPKPQVFRPRKR